MHARTLNIGPAQGRALYHDIWWRLRQNFWDPGRIVWSDWRNCFDDQIDCVETGKKAARHLVRALDERYTMLLEKSSGGDKRGECVSSRALADNIGYLRIESFGAQDVFDQVSRKLTVILGCDAFIIDLRDNRGGLMMQAAKCLELFIRRGLIATIEKRALDGIKTTRLCLQTASTSKLVTAPDGTETAFHDCRAGCLIGSRPIVLLVNGRTASAAEMFAAAMLADGELDESCIAIGSRTTGKGIIQDSQDFGYCTLQFTTGLYLSPWGQWFGDAGQTKSNGLDPTVFVNDANDRPVRRAIDHLTCKLAQQKLSYRSRHLSWDRSSFARAA